MTEWPDFAGLADHQLVQCEASGVATISLQGAAPADWKGSIAVTPADGQTAGRVGGGRWQCTFPLRTGGPYDIHLSMRNTAGQELARRDIADVLVGDIWLLAGQSNMQGRGDLVDVETPSPMVRAFNMTERWGVAEEPLHRLWEARDPIYHRDGPSGAGLGLTFAKAIVASKHGPVGLVPCAFGGSSMTQWKDSLYGAMLRRLHLAGGKARGILWYQGEADARDPNAARVYGARLRELIAAARKDSGIADLGFYLAQVGRMLDWPYYGVEGRTPPATLDRQFAQVREAQRRIGLEVGHAGTVASIDLGLRDGIHLATPDLKRVGRRLAAIAMGESRGPQVQSVTHDRGAERISVRFSGVAGGFDASARISGFSLRTAEGAEIASIYRAAIDTRHSSTIILSYQGKLPAGAQLAYGWGANPYCNIVDQADRAAPCFGPVELDYASE